VATFTREDDELLAERLADADTDTNEKININCGLPAKMLPLCTPKLKTVSSSLLNVSNNTSRRVCGVVVCCAVIAAC
jgi:hypothetical protein